jgi:putative cell wall-binding protein
VKHGLFNFRRAALTLTLGAGAFAGVVGVAGVAGASGPAAPTVALTAASQPHMSVGVADQAAGTWKLTLTGNDSQGWTDTNNVFIHLAPTTPSCWLYFDGTPTVKVAATSKANKPTVSAHLENTGTCSSSEPNELLISFTSTGGFTTATPGSVTITVSGVRYTVTDTASTGPATVTAQYRSATSPVTTVTLGAASNAYIGGFSVTANTPPVTVPSKAFDASISPVDVEEWPTSAVPTGDAVCVALATGNYFDAAAKATAKESGGTGTVASGVTYPGALATKSAVAAFKVTKAATTVATYTVSGLAVDASATAGPVDVTVTYTATTSCGSSAVIYPVGTAVAYTIGKATTAVRIYGNTPDATAAAELESEFAPKSGDCVATGSVVLATDEHYPDALASAYLASYLQTGTLLTPTSTVSTVTLDAIRDEGITHVYVVGGSLAVSTTDVKKLESTPAYTCGGVTTRTTSGKTVDLTVTRIAGQTAYDTAQDIAQYVPVTRVGTLDVVGAYGHYNDTTGTESSPPSTSTTLPTAILATGKTFADAESSSAMAYHEPLPVLLTTTTKLSSQVGSAIGNLHIKQVIVMGGPLAVSNGVVTTLEKLGVSVLRIAGEDYTDTAVQLADFEMASTATASGLGWSGHGLVVARGDFYTDGLAGAVVAGKKVEPLLLTENPTTVGTYLTTFLQKAGKTGVDGNTKDKIGTLTILGGPDAVSTATVSAMESDLGS